MKMYGSITNRFEENHIFGAKEIYVGMGVTEYMWSDRHAHEVIEVISQEHVIIRRMDSIVVRGHGNDGSAEYEYKSNKNNPTTEIKKYKKGWYEVSRTSVENLKKTVQSIREYDAKYHDLNKGDIAKVERYEKYIAKNKELIEQGCKINVSFGVMDEYYDPSF